MIKRICPEAVKDNKVAQHSHPLALCTHPVSRLHTQVGEVCGRRLYLCGGAQSRQGFTAKARALILRVKEVRPSSVLIVQGRCGRTTDKHMSQCYEDGEVREGSMRTVTRYLMPEGTTLPPGVSIPQDTQFDFSGLADQAWQQRSGRSAAASGCYPAECSYDACRPVTSASTCSNAGTAGAGTAVCHAQ